MQPSEECHDDRREPVSHVEIDVDLPSGAGNLEEPRKPCQRARHAQAGQHQQARVHAREPGGARARTCKADVEPKDVTGQQDMAQDDCKESGDDAPVHARPCYQLMIRRRIVMPEVA